ncbi:MAG: 16S rRNA (cytosine(967)-C(5))-methyltransferase RsmB [Clostridia bacterium]|nr:16S rRNA (cytosine(967)-C(5))-methyltransferase RsmB [Clostridia bacterium]
MPDPRTEAVRLLTKFEKDASYSAIALSEALKNIDFADSRDVSFAVSLVYGVLEHKITLDYNISLYLTSSVKKLKPVVLNCLRIGAYQLLYLDKVPQSAAVNESVRIVKKLGFSFASGLVNAVLRKIASSGLILPDDSNQEEYLSVRFSVDLSIARMLIRDYGFEKAQNILDVFSGRRPIYIRHNTLRCTGEQLKASLEADGVSFKETELEGCISISDTGDISRLSAYKNGYFHVQDMASQICCKLLGAKGGERIIDCCAAPGGKSFTVAQYMENCGSLISCDMYEHKISLINSGAKRLGITVIDAVCSDAVRLNTLYSEADRVLCDVPCSGIGVMGRKPEIRYKNEADFSSLPEIQKNILYSCSEMVRKGGVLIYSTCTLNKKENEEICEGFLRDHPDFYISDDADYKSLTDRFITFLPDKNGSDGFFIAKFIRGSV